MVGAEGQNAQHRCKPAHGGGSHSAAAASRNRGLNHGQAGNRGERKSRVPGFPGGRPPPDDGRGEVVARIDFSNLKPDDVTVNGKEIHLHLPQSQLFRTRLDSEKTRVYSRQTGLLVPTDPNLETQARQEGNVSCKRPRWPMASCGLLSKMRLRPSPVFCRAWDSKRSRSNRRTWITAGYVSVVLSHPWRDPAHSQH
jgi:hypothetical protein